MATDPAAPAAKPTVTFKNDIMPIFYNYRGQMAWRLDLTSYVDVSTNANLIWQNIRADQGPPNMPPYPFPPLTAEELATFQEWMNQECPEG